MKKPWIWIINVLLILVLIPAIHFSPRADAQGIGSRWTVFHAPAANTQATITRTAVAGTVHVVQCLQARLVAGAIAPVALQVNVVLRDGVSGAGTILWQAPISIPALAGDNASPVAQCGLDLVGTVNTAITLEFSAVGGLNTFESVSLSGYDQR